MRAFAAADAGSRWESRLVRSAHPVVARAVDRLVAHRPVRRVPGLGVLVADPVAARRVLSDTDHFAKNGPGSPGALWTPVLGERVLLNMEGADHRALRRSLADLFSPRTVAGVCQGAVAPIVTTARERLLAGHEVDVVALARDVSAAAISVVVGLDAARHRSDLLAANDAIQRLVTWRTRALSPAQADAARDHLALVQDAAEAAHRGADPGTVMGRLGRAGASADEARSLAAALFLTGTGTVSAALPRIVGQLADAGLLAEAASSDRAARRTHTAGWVTEGLRMTTPSLATLRRCTAATDLGGVALRPDDRLVVLLWWATRLAGGFDPDRALPADLRHLWFGAGSHFCLGAPLAMAELHLMTSMLLDVADERGLRVVRRSAARRVLLPQYAELVVAAA